MSETKKENQHVITDACPEELLPNNAQGFEDLCSGRNFLFYGDNLPVMQSLLARQHNNKREGCINFVYIDPPFGVGADFHARIPPPAGQGDGAEQGAAVSSFAYSDIWEGGLAGYLAMLRPRLVAMRDLLAPCGVICVHCDYRASHHIRLMLDDIFGVGGFINEIIWHYTGGGRSARYFSRKHDSLFLYGRGPRWVFNADAVRVPYKPTSGFAKGGIVSKAGKRYLPNPQGTPVDDVWDIPIVNPLAKERNGYATQKPEKLLERLILALTNPGDLVADFFCGSGTTLAVANRLNRRWIGCDAGELAVGIARKRLGEAGAVFEIASVSNGAG